MASRTMVLGVERLEREEDVVFMSSGTSRTPCTVNLFRGGVSSSSTIQSPVDAKQVKKIVEAVVLDDEDDDEDEDDEGKEGYDGGARDG